MSNVVDLQRVPRLRCASPPSEAMARDLDLDVASPIVAWRAIVVEEVRNSVLLLDLAAQHARLMTERIFDQQARQNLIRQIETIERQLQRARDMTSGL
jgi:hypothetical protein